MLRSGRQTLPATFKELRAFMPRVQKCADACKQLPLPIAVMLAGSDSLIMPQQVCAAADYFGVEPIILPDLAHDIMLVRLCLAAVQWIWVHLVSPLSAMCANFAMLLNYDWLLLWPRFSGLGSFASVVQQANGMQR